MRYIRTCLLACLEVRSQLSKNFPKWSLYVVCPIAIKKPKFSKIFNQPNKIYKWLMEVTQCFQYKLPTLNRDMEGNIKLWDRKEKEIFLPPPFCIYYQCLIHYLNAARFFLFYLIWSQVVLNGNNHWKHPTPPTKKI